MLSYQELSLSLCSRSDTITIGKNALEGDIGFGWYVHYGGVWSAPRTFMVQYALLAACMTRRE